MQEHPVPQNVTGYEFHLIGQMTLKQFMEIAGGVLLAVIINLTNLPTFIKYPIMVIVGFAGAILAFVPLEGRPLDRWFFAFIRSIYQPTLFYWKKTSAVPPVFTYTPPQNLDTTPQVDYTPIRQARVQEFIHTVSSPKPQQATDEDSVAATAVLSLFSSPDLPAITSEPIETVIPRSNPVVVLSPPDASSVSSVPTAPQQMGHILEMEVEQPPAITQPTPLSPQGNNLPTPGGIVPQTGPIGYAQKNGVEIPVSVPAAQPTQVFDAQLSSVQSPMVKVTREPITKPAQVLTGFPFPNKPTEPNVVAGMVVNLEGKIIEGAIVTILRQADRTPVRAMKTNTLGQFAVVTALDSGEYLITIEKEGYGFDIYSLHIDNKVLEPIILKSR